MSGVKKDQGGVEEETSTLKRTGAAHSRVGLATDLKRCFFRSSWSQSSKNIWVWEAFSFLGRLTITLKFSMEFNKKKKSKTKEACGIELPCHAGCQALRRPSVCAFRTGVLHAIESLCSASSVTGQIYLEEWNVAGGEEEKEWVFAPESDNVVILKLVPYQVKTQSAKRATNVLPKSNESVRRAFFPELHHSSMRHLEAFASPSTSWLESRSDTDFDFLIVGLVGPFFYLIVGLVGRKRRRIESGKTLIFSVSKWQKCSRQFACHPEPFARFFVCAYAALHRVLSYAMTYSHKPHWRTPHMSETNFMFFIIYEQNWISKEVRTAMYRWSPFVLSMSRRRVQTLPGLVIPTSRSPCSYFGKIAVWNILISHWNSRLRFFGVQFYKKGLSEA